MRLVVLAGRGARCGARARAAPGRTGVGVPGQCLWIPPSVSVHRNVHGSLPPAQRAGPRPFWESEYRGVLKSINVLVEMGSEKQEHSR